MLDRLILMIILLPAILIALIVHEVAHGRVAFYRGDPTAYYKNRLSLNPLVHLDKLGTSLLVGTIFFSMLANLRPIICLGWAKPVPVDERYLENSKLDLILVSLAGPAVNILMAFIAGLPFKIGLLNTPSGLNSSGYLELFLYLFININILLAVFNLIPLPPLDGSKVLMQFLPEKYQNYIKYPTKPVLVGTIMLALLIINWSGFSWIVSTLIGLCT